MPSLIGAACALMSLGVAVTCQAGKINRMAAGRTDQQ